LGVVRHSKKTKQLPNLRKEVYNMSECEKFKSLLEYFVAHLEYCVTDLKDGEGYTRYIKDIQNFNRSGQGHKGQNIQNQIRNWKSYINGNICINVNPTVYKGRGCYLNWEYTAINVNAVWNNNTIVALKIVKDSYPISNAKDVLSYNIEDLGLLDNKPPNENLKIFFDKFNELIIERNEEQEFNKKMENIKPYIELLKASKNIILTGAPGTGKTYLAKQIAKQMIGVKTDEELEESGQFAFVQFHPSYDYTDFVEGLRPTPPDANGNIGFELKDGVFKAFCEKAKINYLDSQKSETDLQKEKSVQSKLETFLVNAQDNAIIFKTKTGSQFTIADIGEKNISINIPENQVASSIKVNLAEVQVLLEKDVAMENVNDIRKYFKRKFNTQQDSYTFVICQEIKKQKEEQKIVIQRIDQKPFVFIIDEINRGEISKIFGELFFSIDPSYRGEKGAVKTQYSNMHDNENEVFFVPDNVYIIGSMNDIDRSVESFDFAMRRRFTWIEITAEQSAENMSLPVDIKGKMLKLNEQITKTDGLNPSYHIGAAYFLDSNGNAIQDIDSIWNLRIEPLLKEYLRGIPDSFEKIKLLKKAFTE
jgi:5-methylcytosine-specific restriction protein B